MKKATGWDVFLKIQELSRQSDTAEIHIDDVVKVLGIAHEQAHEYLTALSVLEFIKYTNGTRLSFIITDMGRP
jgi:predicted transcriptional regulator